MSVRENVFFNSDGARCAAWLYLPDSTSPAPVIVMAHGLGAVRRMRLDAYAEHFRTAGYACLVFDYRHFGDSEGEPRQLLDITRQLADWSAAIDFARSLPQVDGTRVVLWGSSFGGGHVIAAGARDGHVAAVIAQCPFTDGIASSLALGVVSSVKVGLLGLRDLAAKARGKQPIMVAVAGPPKSAALMTAPDAEPGYLRLVPEDYQFRNEAAARFGLQIIGYRPGRKAARLSMPALFCVCENDTVAPSGATKRLVSRAPKGELKLYPQGHFEIYVGDGFDTVTGDQLGFLRRHVPVRR